MLEDQVETIFREGNRMHISFGYYGCCSANEKLF